jgi:signal transduction histidine kinase
MHGVDHRILEDMKLCVGFNRSDASNLRSLATDLAPAYQTIVDEFYGVILRNPRARSILTEGDTQIERLRAALRDWLRGLFCGKYDQEYWEVRSRIGRTHLRVGTPQDQMITMMAVIRRGLQRAIHQTHVVDADAKLESVHKLLTLELAVMLDSYKASYTEKVQEHERSAVEAKLTRAEHLAEIGQLAASLAHEIKNPLAGISGAIQVIRDGLEPNHRHRVVIGEILRQVNRLDAVVKDLLVYARPSPPSLARCNLDAVIRRVIAALAQEPSLKHVRLDYDGDDEMAPIRADHVRMEQLVMNLVLNAAHASPPDGKIRIEARSNTDRVTLTVKDSGHGMDEAILERAFEPFFTTKAKGTGLGLPICKWIVDVHGGSISLHSLVGKGTRVIVKLPRTVNGSDEET